MHSARIFVAILAFGWTLQISQAQQFAAPPTYRTTGRCESNQICSYKYYSSQRNFDGEQLQVTTVQATVEVRCSSVGTYGTQRATRYCITVKDVTVKGDLFEDSSDDEVLEDTREDIPELDPRETVLHRPPVSPEDKLVSQWFCFIQTEDGKVDEVQHPSEEITEVVNFKKGITAAFQSNFRGTTEEEEEDPMSQHVAIYRYRNGGSTALRYVNTANVIAYAGGTPRDEIQLSKNEYISYSEGSLSYSSGTTTVVFGAKGTIPTYQLPYRDPTGPSNQHILADVPEYINQQESISLARKKRQIVIGAPGRIIAPPPQQTYDDSADFTEFQARGQYRLRRVECREPNLRGRIGYARRRRDAEEDRMDDVVTDSLSAKIDHKLIDRHQMQILRQRLPSIPQILETLHQDTDNSKLADSLHRLLLLEAEHKPLPGFEAAVNDVLAYLHRLKGSEEENDREMRKLIYSFLSPEGSLSAQKALVGALTASSDREEKNALISYIAFAANPHLRFVKMLERLIDPDTNSTDPLLLAYGSLASSGSPTAEQHIVRVLLDRLHTVDSMKGNNTWPLIHLIHSLGNSASQLTIEPLLRYLLHEDIDVQLAAIGAMGAHTTDQSVREAFAGVLQMATMEEQVEEITQTLIEGLEHVRLNGKIDNRVEETDNEMLLFFLVSSAMQSNNTKLHELVLHYLHELDTKESRELVEVLNDYITKHPGFEGETYYVNEGDNGTAKARVRRGSDWDAVNSIYNLVGSYSQRHSDVLTYPAHKAYIWGKKFGLSKVYVQIAAGGFAGLKSGGSGYKLFAKAVAQGYAFGKTATALRAEFLRRRSGSSIYQKIYAKVVGKTLINEAGYVSFGCSSLTKTLYSAKIKIFYFKYSIFIYVGTLDFYIGMYAKLSLYLKLGYCELQTSAKTCATLIPRAALRAEGGASATILLIVRGGIEVAAEFTYQLEPEVCVHFCNVYPGPTLKTKLCINIYHSWPNNYAEIYAYYQLRKFQWWPPKFYWGPKKKWNALSKKWNLGSIGRKKIWGICDNDINCLNFVIRIPPVLFKPLTRIPPVLSTVKPLTGPALNPIAIG